MRLHKIPLLFAGVSNLVVGVLHIAIMFMGVPAFQYLGAPDSLVSLVRHHRLLHLLFFMIPLASLFIVAGLYALSGVGFVRRLPRCHAVLFVIGVMYTLRGAVVVLWPFPSVVTGIIDRYPLLLGMGRAVEFQDWVFSFLWLLVGVCYLIGWRQFSRGDFECR